MEGALPFQNPQGNEHREPWLCGWQTDENSCVEFTGMHDGPSKKVTGFEGDGKLLRDIIVPSLQSFH
jgi:hypothetical protein